MRKKDKIHLSELKPNHINRRNFFRYKRKSVVKISIILYNRPNFSH